jgi:F0F1-type ATP synthase membrane subunit b/b'
MIRQAKAAIESRKNAAMAELKSHVSTLSLSIAENIEKTYLTKRLKLVVENMLGDVKVKLKLCQEQSSNSLCKSNSRIAQLKVAKAVGEDMK